MISVFIAERLIWPWARFEALKVSAVMAALHRRPCCLVIFWPFARRQGVFELGRRATA
jgi:hypothetical protein